MRRKERKGREEEKEDMKEEEKHQQFHLSACFNNDPNCLLWEVGSYGGERAEFKGAEEVKNKGLAYVEFEEGFTVWA